MDLVVACNERAAVVVTGARIWDSRLRLRVNQIDREWCEDPPILDPPEWIEETHEMRMDPRHRHPRTHHGWMELFGHFDPPGSRERVIDPHLCRYGVELAGGQRATIFDPWLDVGRGGPRLSSRGGKFVTTELELVPRPDGPFTFVCEWPAFGIPATGVTIDPAALAREAPPATDLWSSPVAAGEPARLSRSTFDDRPAARSRRRRRREREAQPIHPPARGALCAPAPSEVVLARNERVSMAMTGLDVGPDEWGLSFSITALDPDGQPLLGAMERWVGQVPVSDGSELAVAVVERSGVAHVTSELSVGSIDDVGALAPGWSSVWSEGAGWSFSLDHVPEGDLTFAVRWPAAGIEPAGWTLAGEVLAAASRRPTWPW